MLVIVYFLFYAFYLYRANRNLRTRAYSETRTARTLFPLVEKASDEPTADLLTQRIGVHEQAAWMLRALLEE